jgi:hypothetical protein
VDFYATVEVAPASLNRHTRGCASLYGIELSEISFEGGQMEPNDKTPVIDFVHFWCKKWTNATAIRPLAASDIIRRPPTSLRYSRR